VLFVRAALLLPFVTMLLRMRGFRYTHRFLKRSLTPAKNDSPGAQIDACVALTSRLVRAAARNSPIPSTCLERSLAQWWLLARQGIAAQLRIGVRKESGKFTAHAWVEYDGIAIGEPESSHLHYAAFAEEMSGDIR
jgi:hypothetical protein